MSVYVAPRTKPLYKFVARLINGEAPSKDAVRKSTLRYLAARFKAGGRTRYRLLTLPSSWWIAEKELLALRGTMIETRGWCSWHLTIHGCERDRKLFDLAGMRIPKQNGTRSLKHGFMEELECQVLSNGKDVVLFHADIFDYMAVAEKRYDIVWLDTTTPITHLYKGLAELPRVLAPSATVILNVMKGRENIPINGDRHEHIVDYLCSVASLQYLRCDEYKDTTPMMQFLFTT